MPSLRVLVAGGSGFVGKSLANVLKSRGHSVQVVGRAKSSAGASRGSLITWDDLLSKGDSLRGFDAVVNVSGQNVLNPMKRWNEAFKRECIESRIETTQALAQLITLSKEPPKVFITTSAVGIYPTNTGETFDETTPLTGAPSVNGKEFPQWLTRAIEQASMLPADMRELQIGTFSDRPTVYKFGLLKAAREFAEEKTTCEHLAVRRAVVRLGVVLGAQGGAFQMQKIPFSLGLGGCMGSGKQFMPWIHLEDAARLYAHIIENESVSGVFNAVAPELVTNSDFTTALAKQLNRPAFMHTPEFALNFAFGGPERSVFLLEGQKVVPKRTLESGFAFSFPKLQNALKDLTS